MLGNVYEWCQDTYRAYEADPVTDPSWNEGSALRTVRGGSWFEKARSCRAAFREGVDPVGAGYVVGFRISRSKNEA